METEVRCLMSKVLVMMPVGTTMQGNVLTLPNGEQYAVAPALYRITPTDERPATVFGGEVSGEWPAWQPEYIPPEEWPPDLDIDSAVYAAYSPPLETETVG